MGHIDTGTPATTPAVAREDQQRPLVDPFGRAITYLRVSVTDRCDFRCVYCMAEQMTFLPKVELLTLEELDRVCSAFIRLGTRKLRLTGGEPLVRRGIMGLIKGLSRHLDSGALDELTLTTNGSQLEKYAEGAGSLRRPSAERLAGHARPREVRGDHPLGQVRQGDGRPRRRAERGDRDQDQRRRAQGRQRGGTARHGRLVRPGGAST